MEICAEMSTRVTSECCLLTRTQWLLRSTVDTVQLKRYPSFDSFFVLDLLYRAAHELGDASRGLVNQDKISNAQ
jgi:hypothetical protein